MPVNVQAMLGCTWPVLSGEVGGPTTYGSSKVPCSFILFLSLGTFLRPAGGLLRVLKDWEMDHFTYRMASCLLTGANGVRITV